LCQGCACSTICLCRKCSADRLLVGCSCAFSLPTPLADTRQSEKLKPIFERRLLIAKDRRDPARESSKTSQIHLVVQKNGNQRFRIPPAHEFQIDSGDIARAHILAAIPPQNMTFELRQFHRSKPQTPKVPCRVK